MKIITLSLEAHYIPIKKISQNLGIEHHYLFDGYIVRL